MQSSPPTGRPEAPRSVEVNVRLFASLRDRLPPETRGRGRVALREGASLQDLIDHFEIPPKLAQMVLIDGQQAPRDTPARAAVRLAAGATVSIFPPLAGG